MLLDSLYKTRSSFRAGNRQVNRGMVRPVRQLLTQNRQLKGRAELTSSTAVCFPSSQCTTAVCFAHGSSSQPLLPSMPPSSTLREDICWSTDSHRLHEPRSPPRSGRRLRRRRRSNRRFRFPAIWGKCRRDVSVRVRFWQTA